jgi:hypothetical protein
VFLALHARVLETAQHLGRALRDVVVPVLVVGQPDLDLRVLQEGLDVHRLREKIVHAQQVDLELVPVEELRVVVLQLVHWDLHQVHLEVVLYLVQLDLQVHVFRVDSVLLK